MKTIIRLIVCLLLVMGWGLAAPSLHVIRTPDPIPITLITKERFGITDTYVDTRNWTINDAVQHPLLVQKLLDAGKADVLKHVIANDSRAASTTASAANNAEVSRTLGDAVRSVQKDVRDRATQPSSTAQQAAHGLAGWF